MARQMYKRVIGHKGRDQNFHISKHQIERKHPCLQDEI